MYIVVFIIGLGLIALGMYNLFLRMKLIPMSKVIMGTVVDMRETSTRRNGRAYYPVIEYLNPETSGIESYQHEVANGRSKYNMGDTLELRYYNGGNRKLIVINTWSGKWLTPIMFTIAGVVFTGFGVLMVIF